MTRYSLLSLLLLVAVPHVVSAETTLRNSRYTLEPMADGAVLATVDEMPPQRISGEFTVLWSDTDPHCARNPSHPGYAIAPRVALRWRNPADADRMADHVNPFHVGQRVEMQPLRTWTESNLVRWDYKAVDAFTLHAEIRLPAGDGDPLVTFTITPQRDAFFSVAFTGAPDSDVRDTLFVPQECSARGHRQFNFVMSEADLHLPRAHVASKAGNVALVADPTECRFRLPTFGDSRFGCMLSSEHERLKPVLLAPLLGGPESQMHAGEPWQFTFRCVLQAGDWKDTFAHIARDIHSFHDQRDNSGPGSLNDCLARVMDFLADRNGGNRAMWDPQQKYFDYFNDKTGVFKPFSPLYGLGAAIVTDDEEFFRKRARPAVEYALSRRSLIFAPYDTADNKQANSAERNVGAPCIGREQLMSLDALFQGRSPVLRTLAESQANRASQRPSLYNEDGFFNLLDQASATRDPNDIAAAREAAYHNAAKLNLYPAPPDADVTVDRDGQVPVHLHSFGRHRNQWGFPMPQPLRVPEQTVPAWRIARLGLPGTAYPIEYWMNTHGAMLRTASLADDDFLRSIARWGMVGRFGNFPGDNRSRDSLVAEKPDAVERAPWEWNFATVNPGHAWDFAGAVVDFLVSDAFDRSRGAIDFPAVSAAGSSFRVRIYGAEPGTFYGDSDVRLWLPEDLITSSNRQLDWIAAHGNGQLYLALINQSFDNEHADIAIRADLARCREGAVRCWRNNAPTEPLTVMTNSLRVDVPARGIIALAVPASVQPRLQPKLYDTDSEELPLGSFTAANASFGQVQGTLLRAGGGLTSAFIYTDALPENVISARLRWRQGDGGWQELADEIYPYEFSPDVRDDAGDVECVFEIENSQQQVQRAPVITLLMNKTAKPQPGRAIPDDTTSQKRPATTADTNKTASDAKVADATVTTVLTDDFITYIQNASNGHRFGLRDDGRFYPYSTPQGRCIAWRQRVWDKTLFATGCTHEVANRKLRAALIQTASELTTLLATREPSVDFQKLDQRQQETLLDLAHTEGVKALSADVISTVIARDWQRLAANHLYVRYTGHVPDHPRNKAFALRWGIR